MTSEEIVRALRCCEDGDCWNCRMRNDEQRCQERLLGSAAEMIERLEKEKAALVEAANPRKLCDISQCRELPCPYDNNCMQKQVWERLRAYEDTRLSPEGLKQVGEIEEYLNECGSSIARVAELIKADDERRVVMLSCKIGDRVYVPDIQAQTVANIRVQGISITQTGRVVLHFGGYPATSVWGDRCGIDWFITREEAEKALEARKDG